MPIFENDFTVDEDDIPSAIVTFGAITPDDNNAQYEDDEIDDGIFTDYKVTNRYEFDRQRWMMPVTSPDGFQGDQVAFVQLAARTALLISDWTAEKVGSKPAIPEPDPVDDNAVLLDTMPETEMIMLKPDGVTKVWRVSGSYVYGFKNPNDVKICHARPPWMQDDGDCDVESGQYTTGIICCGDGSESGGEGDGSEEDE